MYQRIRNQISRQQQTQVMTLFENKKKTSLLKTKSWNSCKVCRSKNQIPKFSVYFRLKSSSFMKFAIKENVLYFNIIVLH